MSDQPGPKTEARPVGVWSTSNSRPGSRPSTSKVKPTSVSVKVSPIRLCTHKAFTVNRIIVIFSLSSIVRK